MIGRSGAPRSSWSVTRPAARASASWRWAARPGAQAAIDARNDFESNGRRPPLSEARPRESREGFGGRGGGLRS